MDVAEMIAPLVNKKKKQYIENVVNLEGTIMNCFTGKCKDK